MERKKPKITTVLYKQRYLLMMLLPGLLWFFIFKYITYSGLLLAFTDYGFRAEVAFVGLKNFQRLFKSVVFWNAFRNTIIISLCNIIFYFPIPLIIALMINELKSVTAKRSVQFLIYIPYFFSWVIVGAIFANILSPSSGVVNNFLVAIGREPIYFFASTKWFRPILIVSYIWRQMGYGAVIYVATLTTVDPQLYEAAAIDGSGRWKQLWHITLPSIKTTIITMLLLNLSHVLKIFEQVQVMYNSSVYSVSDVLQTHAYREGVLSGNIAYSTAISLLVGIISLVLVLGTNMFSKKILDDSIL
jgi:ABC-type polysaccharide transport system, permease component